MQGLGQLNGESIPVPGPESAYAPGTPALERWTGTPADASPHERGSSATRPVAECYDYSLRAIGAPGIWISDGLVGGG